MSFAYLKSGSATVTVVESTCVVVPSTVKLPVIVAFPSIEMFAAVISLELSTPSTVTSLKVTLSVVPTACPILNSPEADKVTPVPPDK